MGPTVCKLIDMLTDLSRKSGDIPVEFFSDEWTDDLEEMQYQQRWLHSIDQEDGVVRFYLDH